MSARTKEPLNKREQKLLGDLLWLTHETHEAQKIRLMAGQMFSALYDHDKARDRMSDVTDSIDVPESFPPAPLSQQLRDAAAGGIVGSYQLREWARLAEAIETKS